MSRRPIRALRILMAPLCTAVALLALAACHDARRDNPMDPELTPPAAGLQAAVDDSAGVVLLSWEPYVGPMPFDHYLVLRKARGFEAVDSLARIPDPTIVGFADTTAAPDVAYEYRVAVVNAAGFAHASAPVSVRPFAVRGVELLSVGADTRTGVVTVTWRPYGGPGFEGYEVWRRTVGLEPRVLAVVTDRAVGTWQDTSAVPATRYTYWVRTRLYEAGYDSGTRQLAYALPRPRLTELALSSDCACARVAWSAYLGPRFAAYEVRRRALGEADTAVARILDRNATTILDSLLDGDTSYSYRVKVQTTWLGVEVESSEVTGQFHGLQGERRLVPPADTEVQAIDLAVDEADGVFAVTTAVSTTTARVMGAGVRLYLPGAASGRNYFIRVVPDRHSPVRLAVARGWVFVAVADADGIVAFAIAPDGTEAWTSRIAEGRPTGLYADGDEVVLVDQQALLYRLGAADGRPISVGQDLRTWLALIEGLPLQDAAFAPAVAGGADEWFVLAPDRRQHRLLARVEDSAGPVDDGVGPGRGQVLDPLVLAHDPRRARLVALENRGLLQVLDASQVGGPRHYVTRWGRFGQGPGEFLVTKPTAVAVAVDAEGRIHVADAATPGGRIQTFAP